MKEFREYIASTKFTIGIDTEKALTVTKGTPVSFNGREAVIDGQSYQLPQLSNAIKVQWLVLPEDLGLEPTRISANIKMSHPTDDSKPAVTASTATSDEEREVGQVGQVGRHQIVTESSEGEVVSNVKFSTSARTENTRVDQLSTNSEDRLVNTRDKAASMQEAERLKMQREIESLKSQLSSQNTTVREGIRFNTDGVSRNASDTTEAPEDNLPEGVWDGNDAKVVGSTTGDVVAQPVDEREAKIALAKMMVPDFDWDFDAHWRTKIKVLEEKSNTLYTAAVYAVETDGMKKNIAKHFPELGK